MSFAGSLLGEASVFSLLNTASLSITFSRFVPSFQNAFFSLHVLNQAKIVTADGTALTVSDSENADLFWGIRGGGSNFGVCTEFILRLHPQRRTVFSGLVIFPPNVLDRLLEEISEWWKTVKDNEAIIQVFGRDPAGHVSDR
jgi:hypothetical protein